MWSCWYCVPAALLLGAATLSACREGALDPRRPFAATPKPVTVQVVSFDGKWLFISSKPSPALIV